MIGNLISPKIALTLLKKRIEKDINKKFDDFILLYDKPAKNIEFHILNKVYPYVDTGAKLHHAIDTLLKAKLDDNQQIDLAIIEYKSGGDTCAKVAYRDKENNKKQIELTL